MNVDHENTIRALKDLPLIANRRWWCCFNLHTWIKWSAPKVVKRGSYDSCEQWRTCVCCGKYERKVLFQHF